MMLYISGPVSLKERLLYTLNKLFVKQVKSFYLLLDPNPFIFLCLLHNTKYIKFTSIQDISIDKVRDTKWWWTLYVESIYYLLYVT